MTDLNAAQELANNLHSQVATRLLGKGRVIDLAIVALFSGGHLLIEDVPGVGKTTLARTLAQCIGGEFSRIQFTSDMMPTDVVGGGLYDRNSGQLKFHRGPIFSNVVLADEINRTTPKTQSALLEAMDERQVSVEGTTYPLEAPFFVVATQNPNDFAGTYPLPESQLDRFAIRTRIGYPAKETERQVIKQRRLADTSELSPITTPEAIVSAQQAVNTVKVADPIIDYLHSIVLATREHHAFRLGASTRAALAFERVSRAYAVVKGRDFVIPDDVKTVATACLAHRVRLAASENDTDIAEQLMTQLLDTIDVPV